VVSSTPRPHFTPGKDPVPIVQEAGWAPGPVWAGGKSRSHRDSIPDRSVRSSVAILTELPGPITQLVPGVILGGKRRRREVYHSPPPNAEVTNEWSCTSNSTLYLRGLDRYNFTFFVLVYNRLHSFDNLSSIKQK